MRPPEPRPAVVNVGDGTSAARVDLARLVLERRDGRTLVSLAALWAATGFADDRAALRFDLVGEDGFATAQKPGLGLRGELLDVGFVDVGTRDVVWTVEVPCFFRVKGLVELIARRASAT